MVQVILCFLAVSCMMLPGSVHAQEPGVVVTDRTLRLEIAKRLGIQAARLATGTVSLYRQSGSNAPIAANAPIADNVPLGSDAPIIVFLDGTEIGRFEKARAEQLLADFPEIREQLTSGPSHLGAAKSEAGADEGSHSWLSSLDQNGIWGRLGQWDENAILGYDLDYSYSGVLVRRQKLKVAAVKKLGFLYLGGEVDYLSFKGELPDSVPYSAKVGKVGAGFRIGVDYIRYHVQWSPFALPDYFWTESDLRGKYFARGAGTEPTKVLKIFQNTAPPSLSHSLEARLGVLRYTLTVAPDVYRSPIHYVALDDLPGFLGTWGMGVVLTPEGMIPGGWFRFAPIGLTSLQIGDEGIPVKLGLGRIAYFGSDRSQFHVAWSGELSFGLKSKERN